MTDDDIRRPAVSVLYEGYLPYPYRPRVKNVRGRTSRIRTLSDRGKRAVRAVGDRSRGALQGTWRHRGDWT